MKRFEELRLSWLLFDETAKESLEDDRRSRKI
jgi:hypothetical protein